MRIKALARQYMHTLGQLHKTLPPDDAMRLLCSLQCTIDLYQELRAMAEKRDLHTSTLDGAAGFERCRADYKRYRDPLAPTDRELRQEEEYYRNLEQQEDITDHEPA